MGAGWMVTLRSCSFIGMLLFLIFIIMQGCAQAFAVRDIVSSFGYLLYRLCNIWRYMCSADTFNQNQVIERTFSQHSFYHYHRIRSIDLFHYCHIFHGCVWGSCTALGKIFRPFSCSCQIFKLIFLDCYKDFAYCNAVSCMQFIHCWHRGRAWMR